MINGNITFCFGLLSLFKDDEYFGAAKPITAPISQSTRYLLEEENA
jgi:hypothetical protein